MNPTYKELAEKVIDCFKKSTKANLIPANDLKHLLPDSSTADKVIDPLEKDFGLIERSGKYSFRLTERGWKFTTFSKLEKDSKKTPLNRYQIISTSLSIFFGLSTLILGYLNYDSNRKNDELKIEIDSFKTKSMIYKDSVQILNKQIKQYKENR